MQIINPNKMKWEKVESGNVPLIDLTEVKEFVGIYQSTDTDIGPNNSNIYNFKNLRGEEVCFWGTTLLDSRLKTAEAGDVFKIVYLGKAKSEKSGREYHNFDVFHGRGEEDDDIPVVGEKVMPQVQPDGKIKDMPYNPNNAPKSTMPPDY